MRTFDYSHLPQKLYSGKIADAHMRVYEDRGKLGVIEQMHPELLEPLKAVALADSVAASTRIEGFPIDTARAAKLMEGADPVGETERQVIGYGNALALINANPDAFDLTTATAVKLFETLYGHRDLGRKSRYRKKDYIYVQVDGHSQAVPVSPITAFETPLVLGGVCDSLADTFAVSAGNPLVQAAVFTVDFMCIRPFDEGNGRIARLFADLLMKKAGFDVSRYMSVDRAIEDEAMAYYDALNGSVEGWDRGANDYSPYVLYWLELLHKVYGRLFDAVDAAANAPSGKSERVRAFVRQAAGPVTKRQILDANTDISEATVENALGKMVKAGEVEKLGAGRSTAYRWL